MIVQHSRSVLLAGLMTVGVLSPAWSAEIGAAKTEATEQPVLMAAAAQAGPMIARESLSTPTAARTVPPVAEAPASPPTPVVVSENEPTRGTFGRRYAGQRAGAGYVYSAPRPHRTGLMLGIGY